MWKKHLRCQQLDEVSRATLVVFYKRGVLITASGRGAQRPFSSCKAWSQNNRQVYEHKNVQMTAMSINHGRMIQSMSIKHALRKTDIYMNM
jgi:hypothetical protein